MNGKKSGGEKEGRRKEETRETERGKPEFGILGNHRHRFETSNDYNRIVERKAQYHLRARIVAYCVIIGYALLCSRTFPNFWQITRLRLVELGKDITIVISDTREEEEEERNCGKSGGRKRRAMFTV